MPKLAWTIAGILTGVLLVVLLAFYAWNTRSELQQARTELNDLRDSSAKAAAKVNELEEKVATSGEQISHLQKEKAAVEQSHQSLEDQMRSALESKDVTISQLQGKLTVNILDRVLFESGEAELKPGGASVLEKVAKFLTDHPNLKIHVIGHTDNVPIKATARSRFPSNWELSTARATAAVRFLADNAGVDPRRMGAVGYGEFRPVADNSTSEGRASNRRIAITILSEELAGADTTGAKTGTSPTAGPGAPAEPSNEQRDPAGDAPR